MESDLHRFLSVKLRNLAHRARRLSRLDYQSIGIRPEDLPYVPGQAHLDAANQRLADIDADVRKAMKELLGAFRAGMTPAEELLRKSALVERQMDRARRAYGLFFEVFGQRGTSFAQALAACDEIAADCFRAVRQNAPGLLARPLLKPVTYLEHGFSPATFRRGVVLTRLLGEQNPFPLVRIPYERIEAPWGMGVLLHEVGHNLQSDLGIWHETQIAVQRRVLVTTGNAWLARIWTRWHREIFADIAALFLGGPASARSMKDFLAYPAARVLTFRPMGVHPTPYLRALLLAETLRRMGFADDARVLKDVWQRLYTPHLVTSRIPRILLSTASRVIPHVIDEIAFQTRRGLGMRALADVLPFTPADEAGIQAAARVIAQGRVPADLPARFCPSASRFAFENRLAEPNAIARTVLSHLAAQRSRGGATVVRAAA